MVQVAWSRFDVPTHPRLEPEETDTDIKLRSSRLPNLSTHCIRTTEYHDMCVGLEECIRAPTIAPPPHSARTTEYTVETLYSPSRVQREHAVKFCTGIRAYQTWTLRAPGRLRILARSPKSETSRRRTCLRSSSLLCSRKCHEHKGLTSYICRIIHSSIAHGCGHSGHNPT